MPAFVLTVLKFALLALLYLFIYRAIRAIVQDLYGGEGRRPRRRPRPAGAPRSAPARRVPRSVVVLDESGRRVTTVPLDGTLQIGRGPACDIRPDDRYLSQAHARISRQGEGWVVEDLGSTNGTFLNERKVTVPSPISVGDRIRVGKTILEVRG